MDGSLKYLLFSFSLLAVFGFTGAVAVSGICFIDFEDMLLCSGYSNAVPLSENLVTSFLLVDF